MKLSTRSVVLCTALLCGAAHAQESPSIAQARSAASSWLALVDAGNYSASWVQASSLFKKAVSEPSWASAVRGARGPLGALKSRQEQSATFTRTLPGAPDGDYVVIRYASRFASKPDAVETVTPMREKDGSWHVSGYFVK